MGEYAIRKSDGQEIKIGTCEQMYYLRADQVEQIAPLNRNNTNPQNLHEAEAIRFRFPFPQEDGVLPLEDAKPVLDVLAKYAADEDRQHQRDEEHHKCKLVNRGDYYREVARRIVAGYTEPNYWTQPAELATA